MRGTLLIKGGHLLTQDNQHGEMVGDILIRDGAIVEIAGSIEADVETIDARGFAVLPGFVDTHRHTWQTALRGMAAGDSLDGYQRKIQGKFGALFSPEDVYAGNLLGAVAAGQSGITTLCDESHVQNSPAHTDAAVAALRDSGIRAVFDYGWPSVDAPSWMQNSRKTHPTYVRELQQQSGWSAHPLVTLQMMLRGPLMCPIDIVEQDLAFARDLGLRSVMHVVGGSIAALGKAALLGPDMMLIHCCDSSDDELRMVASSGASISSSPNLELNMLGLGAPPIRRFLAAGVRPSLSVDVETSVSGDMFSVMRAALLSQTAEELYQPGALDLPRFSPRDVIAFATIEGARACGLDQKIGSLSVNKRGDVILIDLQDANLAPVQDEYLPDVILANAHPGNVDTVIVDGTCVRRCGKPVELSLVERARHLAAASRSRLRRSADQATA
jgi:5-methylthioadenosine/S-adenosylhomocysteine deaminase